MNDDNIKLTTGQIVIIIILWVAAIGVMLGCFIWGL
jgi:hypothetical protein